jgi:diphthamide biosynthesis protein 4
VWAEARCKFQVARTRRRVFFWTRAYNSKPFLSTVTRLDSLIDYYACLSLRQTATLAEIKLAYHRALLRFHPDKRGAKLNSDCDVDISLIKEAYTVLSSPSTRTKYDAQLKHSPSGPRPAHVVSLEEFEEDEGEWRYPCRCGDTYLIRGEDMEKGVHLIGCNSCSEVIWVGYEVVEENERVD